MSRGLRAVTHAMLALLAATGFGWLILDGLFARTGPFGVEPSPLQPPLRLAHGVLAILGVYLLGWISARHAGPRWSRGLRRTSGATFAASLAVLGLTGFALYFLTDDGWRRAAALAHDVLGVAAAAAGIQHGVVASRRDMRSADSRP